MKEPILAFCSPCKGSIYLDDYTDTHKGEMVHTDCLADLRTAKTRTKGERTCVRRYFDSFMGR
jgi:hypothetical protein